MVDRIKETAKSGWLKFAIVAVLVGVSVFFTFWLNFDRETEMLFPSFYYLPVILASLWWDRKGVVLALLLGALLMITSALSPEDVQIWDEAVRVAALLLTSVVVAELSFRGKSLIGSLEERVRDRTSELEARNTELDFFARTVSHDLVGPLATLNGYAYTAKKASSSGKTDMEMESLDTICTLSERMAYTVKGLLERALDGGSEGMLEYIDAMMISKEVIEELSGIVADRDVEVLVQEDMPATLVDPVKFKQVISNLVGNAIKHAAPEQSLRVEIGGYEEPDTTVFFVRDDGLGIEYDRQKKVFEPFEHVENGNHIPGAGLGLSIVKRDVEGWGGIIWLESTPGKGTTFSFTIPA